MKVEIFSKPDCGYCVMAKSLAETKQIDYEVKMLDVDFSRDELFEQFPGARSFPQIRVDGVAIGGYDQFKKLLETV